MAWAHRLGKRSSIFAITAHSARNCNFEFTWKEKYSCKTLQMFFNLRQARCQKETLISDRLNLKWWGLGYTYVPFKQDIHHSLIARFSNAQSRLTYVYQIFDAWRKGVIIHQNWLITPYDKLTYLLMKTQGSSINKMSRKALYFP